MQWGRNGDSFLGLHGMYLSVSWEFHENSIVLSLTVSHCHTRTVTPIFCLSHRGLKDIYTWMSIPAVPPIQSAFCTFTRKVTWRFPEIGKSSIETRFSIRSHPFWVSRSPHISTTFDIHCRLKGKNNARTLHGGPAWTSHMDHGKSGAT